MLYLLVVAAVFSTTCVFTCLASAAPQGKGNDRVLSKIKFIHYKKSLGKPSGTPGGKPDGKDEGYYTYLAKGAKWKEVEPYILNPTNLDGVKKGDVSLAVELGMSEWESHALADIFGLLTVDTDAPYLDLDVLQEKNTISFRSFDNQNVIAMATVWGYFGGPLSQREIIEAHIELNDDFVWGIVPDPENPGENPPMDMQNILTHELGHCAGMGDLYKTDAIEETMFGYSDEGETNKRDLFKGDIAGITNLY